MTSWVSTTCSSYTRQSCKYPCTRVIDIPASTGEDYYCKGLDVYPFPQSHCGTAVGLRHENSLFRLGIIATRVAAAIRAYGDATTPRHPRGKHVMTRDQCQCKIRGSRSVQTPGPLECMAALGERLARGTYRMAPAAAAFGANLSDSSTAR